MDSLDGSCLSSTGGGTASGAMDVTLDDGEPCTQPMADQEEAELPDSQESLMDTEEEQDDPSVFGYLFGTSGTVLPLSKDIFTVGRSIKTDHQISDTATPNFDAISKVHFILRKEEATAGNASAFSVFIQDKSSNGTFLNGKKIGKEKTKVLNANDRIGLAGPKEQHFVYVARTRDYLRAYPPSLRSRYLVSRELGKGACGTVMLGVRRATGARVAVKIIDKRRVSVLPGPASNVMNEVRLLQKISHPCVIRLEDVIETAETLYIILELADGGELFDKIIEKTKLQEAEAKLHFYQIVSAIEHLHQRNIAHRDLKPEK